MREMNHSSSLPPVLPMVPSIASHAVACGLHSNPLIHSLVPTNQRAASLHMGRLLLFVVLYLSGWFFFFSSLFSMLPDEWKQSGKAHRREDAKMKRKYINDVM